MQGELSFGTTHTTPGAVVQPCNTANMIGQEFLRGLPEYTRFVPPLKFQLNCTTNTFNDQGASRGGSIARVSTALPMTRQKDSDVSTHWSWQFIRNHTAELFYISRICFPMFTATHQQHPSIFHSFRTFSTHYHFFPDKSIRCSFTSFESISTCVSLALLYRD